ncbi:MAG: DUF4342 domain-containing protein [Sphingobacteriales bacterium]|nr:MAG: DUF4342 domain-containing protein [Sphingobacteriales bacterium]
MSFKETFDLNGEQLLQKIKELIKDGNVTKISIADKNDKEFMSFPVNVGLLGLVFAPILAAVGALAALVTECKITVERDVPAAEATENKEPAPEEPGSGI